MLGKYGKGPIGHYHDTVPFATTNFATAAKRNASACNIERHPLRDTAGHPRPLGVARLAMAYPTLRSSTFRSAPLFGSGDQGPLFSNCLYVARQVPIDQAPPTKP